MMLFILSVQCRGAGYGKRNALGKTVPPTSHILFIQWGSGEESDK
jgi:hypothetical protein